MNKYILIISLLIGFNANAVMDKSQYASEYLELIQYEKILSSVLDETKKSFAIGSEEDKRKWSQIMQSIMGWQAIKGDLRQAVMKHFSIDDLKGINAFLKTKVGKRYTNSNVLMEVESSKIILKKMDEVFNNLDNLTK